MGCDGGDIEPQPLGLLWKLQAAVRKNTPDGGSLLTSPRSAQRNRCVCGYGVVCAGKALDPEGEKWKRMSQSLGTLWPSTSGEANCQRRAAFSARSAKYLLGPGESSAASETSPVGST